MPRSGTEGGRISEDSLEKLVNEMAEPTKRQRAIQRAKENKLRRAAAAGRTFQTINRLGKEKEEMTTKPALSTSALLRILQLQGKKVPASAHQLTPEQQKEEFVEEEWEDTPAGVAVSQAYQKWARENGMTGSDRFLTSQEEKARAEAAISDLERRLSRAETRLEAARARGDVPGIERFQRRVSGLEEQLETLFPVSNLPAYWDEEIPVGFGTCRKCNEAVEKEYIRAIGYSLCPQHYRELSANHVLH